MKLRRLKGLFHNFKQDSQTYQHIDLSRNYYAVLEVEFGSAPDCIKTSYLQLVKKYHPDFNPQGEIKFTEVADAYNILADPKMKKYYDTNSQCRPQSQTTHQTYDEENSNRSQNQYQRAKFYQNFSNDQEYRAYRKMEENQRNFYQKKQNQFKGKRTVSPEEEKSSEEKKIELQKDMAKKLFNNRNVIWEQVSCELNCQRKAKIQEEKSSEIVRFLGLKSIGNLKKWFF